MRDLYVLTFGFRKPDGAFDAGSIALFADSEEQAGIAGLVALEENHPAYAAASVKQLGPPNLVSRDLIKAELGLVEAQKDGEGLDYVV